MANDSICVFCGETLGMFRSAGINCANTYQPCCKSCAKEVKELDEAEQCRRALRLGYAVQPEKLEARIELICGAEEHRPACLRCGTKMKFLPVQYLDNSPMRDSIFSGGFELQPVYCPSCGKYEFYNPSIIRKDSFISYLIGMDTSE